MTRLEALRILLQTEATPPWWRRVQAWIWTARRVLTSLTAL